MSSEHIIQRGMASAPSGLNVRTYMLVCLSVHQNEPHMSKRYPPENFVSGLIPRSCHSPNPNFGPSPSLNQLTSQSSYKKPFSQSQEHCAHR